MWFCKTIIWEIFDEIKEEIKDNGVVFVTNERRRNRKSIQRI